MIGLKNVGLLEERPNIENQEISRGEVFGLAFREAQVESPTDLILQEFEDIEGGRLLPAEEAQQRLSDLSLGKNILVPENGISEKQLNYLIERKQEEEYRNHLIGLSGRGFTSFMGGLAGGMTDPATLAITVGAGIAGTYLTGGVAPVAQMANLAHKGRTAFLAQQLTSTALRRVGTSAAIGVAGGTAGAAVFEPFIYAGLQKQQHDYTIADSLMNIATSGAFGGAFGAAGRGIKEFRNRPRKEKINFDSVEASQQEIEQALDGFYGKPDGEDFTLQRSDDVAPKTSSVTPQTKVYSAETVEDVVQGRGYAPLVVEKDGARTPKTYKTKKAALNFASKEDNAFVMVLPDGQFGVFKAHDFNSFDANPPVFRTKAEAKNALNDNPLVENPREWNIEKVKGGYQPQNKNVKNAGIDLNPSNGVVKSIDQTRSLDTINPSVVLDNISPQTKMVATQKALLDIQQGKAVDVSQVLNEDPYVKARVSNASEPAPPQATNSNPYAKESPEIYVKSTGDRKVDIENAVQRMRDAVSQIKKDMKETDDPVELREAQELAKKTAKVKEAVEAMLGCVLARRGGV